MKYTETIKVLLPSLFRTELSATAGDIIKIRNYYTNADWTYRAQIRGLIQKMPGVGFTDYTQSLALEKPHAYITMPQYKKMIDDYAENFSNFKEWLRHNTEVYQWKDGIPKAGLVIKLSPTITKDERTFVANGIRSFFNDILS